MRLKNLIFSEFRLLFKYGIVALYVVFTAFYLCLLSLIPQSAKEITFAILVFTDPAAMGLFFMGAIVLLEKSQRIESSLGVTPIKVDEYIISKTVPIMIVGTAVGLIISLFAGMKTIPLILFGVALSSVLFSLCGLYVGTKVTSLNSFMITTIPFEVALCLPPILFLFGVFKSSLWLAHPGVAAINLITADKSSWHISTLILALWIIPTYLLCKNSVSSSFRRMGGAKL